MTEFQELTQDAQNFVSMERGELVAYAYGMFAAGTKANAENAKLRELAKGYEALTATLCNERECDGCPFNDSGQIVCKHMRLQTCLSELGVEVYG